jgi:multiple sugar transport system substrate-binding protein
MDARQPAEIIGSKRTSRRTVLTRSAQLGAAISGVAASGGITSILASAKAPVFLQDSAPSGKVKFLVYGEAAADQPVFDAFQAEHPDIELEVVGIEGTSWAGFADQVTTRIAGGESYDVVQIATEGQRLFASRGLIEPIDDLIERDAEEVDALLADFHPNLVEWCNTLSSPDGQTYFLPGEFNTMAVWYNTEVFAAAGVAEPTAEWTWDQFLETATALTKPGEVYGMHVPSAYFVGIMPWLLTNGASPLNADWTEGTVNTPEAIEAAAFMRQLIADGISPEPGGEFDAFAAVAQGQLAMVGGGKWPQPNFTELGILDKIKIVPHPQKSGPGSPIGWNSYPIMKSTENREAAWALSKFYAGPTAAEYVQFQVPAQRSVAESEAYLSAAPEGIEVLYAALDYATPVPGPDQGSIIQQDIEDTFAQILIGNLEPEAGLNDLNAKIQSNLG